MILILLIFRIFRKHVSGTDQSEQRNVTSPLEQMSLQIKTRHTNYSSKMAEFWTFRVVSLPDSAVTEVKMSK